MPTHSLADILLPRNAPVYPHRRFPFRAPIMKPPAEESIPLEVAVLCSECEVVYDERVGRCPRCAESSHNALKLITVLNRDGGRAIPKEDN